MDEGVHVVRHVVVDDLRHRVHVDAAGGDVRGDDDAHLTLTEATEDALTLVLREVAVKAIHVELRLRRVTKRSTMRLVLAKMMACPSSSRCERTRAVAQSLFERPT